MGDSTNMRRWCDSSLIRIEENRNRMWAFIFLYVVGSNICQATAGDQNSTQMYYAKLIVENSAIQNITELLGKFAPSSSVRIANLQRTTTCKNDLTSRECECASGYRWSDKVCQADERCCGAANCTFHNNTAHMCVSNNTVTIKGSIRLTGQEYYPCLKKGNQKYITCNDDVLTKMKKVYSTFEGFDVLEITKYRTGSVIADFEMTIANYINPEELVNKTEKLAQDLKGIFNLTSTGVVSLNMPENPVEYNSDKSLTCKLQTDLKTEPVWELKNSEKVSEITNGTESTVRTEPLKTTLTLKNITKVWAGEYTCAYEQTSKLCSISHRASALMDVALLPNIEITTDPQFPRCVKGDIFKSVTGKCEIEKNNEGYSVSWSKYNISPEITELDPKNSSDKTVVYEVKASVSCNKSLEKPKLTCTFENRCNQTKNESVEINIIYVGDKFCPAEDEWQDTKAGHTAVIKCRDADGQKQRECSTDGKWQEEEIFCVNRKVNSLLQDANMVDIGLGTADENAASVFHRFVGITNNSGTINSFANMNASVSILSTLNKKLKSITNKTTVNDLLESSSNLLEESLNKSWAGKPNNDSLTLAEIYLDSVEHLIEITNQVGTDKKPNVELSTCNNTQGSPCNNSVFNVNVSLHGSGSSVKTTGFKQLQNYLPKKNGFHPNSIVVSTTTEDNQDVTVEIAFPLTKQRPRNVELECVSWDNTTRQWSTKGCKWKGPNDAKGEVCACNHLSSFAILMSSYPLNITGLTEMTYVGLSVSVISLVISLVIEIIVWSAVVKTNTLYLRHIAHVNISLCLLIANCCFLASSEPKKLSEVWCKTSVVLKHFCYLSMFFWMLCLSTTVLHQAVFLFHTVSKKHYLRFALILGYVCPLLIVVITFLATNGEKGRYYDKDTCWLVYGGLLKGSIYTFLIPVGIIVVINVFSMLVVIMKLLDHPKSTDVSNEKNRTVAKTVMRSVILLTPVFGVTWIFGFGVMSLDLTDGTIAFAANYMFVLLNSFQGFFILITTCLGDKLTREALLNRAKKTAFSETISERFSKSDSSVRK